MSLRKMLNKLSSNLRRRIQHWLGMDETYIGVDFGHRESVIVIATRVGGGRVKIIETQFSSAQEYERTIKMLSEQYRPKTIFLDAPTSFPYGKGGRFER